MNVRSVSGEEFSTRLSTSLVLFDISDWVYYVGHHAQLTGIQRVQSRIVEALQSNNRTTVEFIAWNHKEKRIDCLDAEFIQALVKDMSRPENSRSVAFDRELSRLGSLPGSTPLSIKTGAYADISIILLGAAWVLTDYFHNINSLRRRYGAFFYMVLHDLVPIFARETCDQGTALVFEEFLRKSFGIVDTYICISENTKKDLLRYCEQLEQPAPDAVVITNGCELPQPWRESENLPSRYALSSFVLLVSTIEGRKNHVLALKTWKRLI